MRPPTYSDEQIIEAGNALVADAPTRPVTAGAIRQRLGGGNLVRIRKVWTAHEAGQAATAHAQQDLPAEWVEALAPALDHVREELLGVMTQFHSQAAASAAQRVDEAIAEKQAAEARNKQELADADAALDAADAEKEKAVEERDRMQAQLEKATDALERHKVDIGALQKTLQDKDSSLHAAHEELGDLREALGVARGDAETAKRLMREAQDQLATVRSERDQLHESLTVVQAESDARRIAIENLQSDLAVVTGERDNYRQQLERKTAEFQASKEALRSTQDSLDTLQDRLAVAETTIQERDAQLTDRNGAFTQLHGEHQALIARLEQRDTDLAAVREALQQAQRVLDESVSREQAAQLEVAELRGRLM